MDDLTCLPVKETVNSVEECVSMRYFSYPVVVWNQCSASSSVYPSLTFDIPGVSSFRATCKPGRQST